MIITLCGSARFEPWFHMWSEALGLAGHAVFALASYPSMHPKGKDWYTPEEKAALDENYRFKIGTSDAILFLNVAGYMGESARQELALARSLGKQVFFLEPSPAWPSPPPWDLLGPSGPMRVGILCRLHDRVAAATK